MQRINTPGLVIDLFAGGGGASKGIKAALGRDVDIAVDHSPVALAVHAANHGRTRHLVADIWAVTPRLVTGGQPVDVLWASPDCTHFSTAKGGQPRKQEIRSLADAIIPWAEQTRPKAIFVENVKGFRGWGPLDEAGQPIKARASETFREWVARLEALGYVVEHRILDASHYGAPTRRRRLFLVARCDGQPIRWPAQTHGGLGLLPLRTAAECIDWSLPCPSIFARKKPLAEKTMARVEHGVKRFVFDAPQPFLTPETNTRQTPVAAFLAKHYGGPRPSVGSALGQPIGTITATDHHSLVTVARLGTEIVDIGLRMLQPHELLKAQFGRFAADYDLSAAKTKTAKIKLIGNSVCPEVAEAMVSANFPRQALREAA